MFRKPQRPAEGATAETVRYLLQRIRTYPDTERYFYFSNCFLLLITGGELWKSSLCQQRESGRDERFDVGLPGGASLRLWACLRRAMEQAADRVFMAARVFVYLFNQRGASLQQRILELLGVADAADEFHKKTVSAAVGGGVASVAGSVATITGLILAPFTFGASIIVTAVGIGVATAGSITSATANITDTKYSESAAKKALNHNIKHVMKEGGRAGKALMINTDKLISTVQVLGSASGVAKAAQAISVTTGVMSALFLALDVFFLAKDSHELRKGAKTKFAGKIRQVCKELQEGLLDQFLIRLCFTH
uniref:Apolipoprotein L domain containing 1a n=1 Tax=Kryptolebias marmoratus TaxID=37003 RepID=A0A3Q3B4Y8_KRYMA